MQSDSVVQCAKCRKKRKVNFARCLRVGWPKCCRSTMRLVTEPTRRMVGNAVRDIMAPLVALRKAMRPRPRRRPVQP